MKRYAFFRLLFAFYLLYFALPDAEIYDSSLEGMFWGSWLLFFFFVVGANLARLLQISFGTLMPQSDSKPDIQRQN
ncbi:hypothetical protein EDD68_10440 [Melghiribacillus thermohalophilus]|uniref:Uncharacterized protein n=1 Tax=Melghiribacillus thermohalophilus TaxID=1324956 RepID=A0A4R3NCQ7_9BACI|nr:hypothetical protein [Melghiribacillus thermohalophilus]TCT24973.1 hypothetical protein EDD68_10440 [Melghiribacillus thermohalophilus]